MSHEHQVLSAVHATLGQRQKAYAVGLLMICACVLTLPLVGTHMPRSEAFILVVETSLALISGLVALLLLLQFSAARSAAMLALACGFLLVTLTTLPQLLRAAQGAFIDPRLGFITDLALPVAAMAYARLRRDRHARVAADRRFHSAMAAGIVMAVSIAALAIWLTTASSSADLTNNDVDGGAWFALATVLVVGADVAAIALLWRRLNSLLELWLLVALIAWLSEALLQGMARDGTSFVWHVAQLYGLLGTVGMMMALLVDHSASHAILASNAARQRLRKRLGDRVFGVSPAQASDTLNVIADELHQPLCAIVVNADAITSLLDKWPQDSAEVRAALDDISNDALRASNTLHAAQRLLADAREPVAVIDIAQLVDECVSQLSTELARHSVTCEVEIAAQLPGIRGFRRQLQHLFINLITQAVEAMSGQQRDRRLRLRTGRHDARAIEIWIEDSGSGLRSWSGLAVCRSIVDAHGGHISVTPRNDGGAAFKVVLPASS